MGWVILIVLFIGIPMLIGALIGVISEIFDGSGHTTSGSRENSMERPANGTTLEPPPNMEPRPSQKVREGVYMDCSDYCKFVHVEYDPGNLRKIKVYFDADRTITIVGSCPYYQDEDHSFIKFYCSPIRGSPWRITAYNTYDTVKYGVYYDDKN